MNHYWFLCRCLRCKAQSSFFWGDKLLNHFSTLLNCYIDLGTPLWGHFIWPPPGLEVWVDYPEWWVGVYSSPLLRRWYWQPPPRGTALWSVDPQLQLNGWLRLQTCWHESECRWPDTRSDNRRHNRQTFRRVLYYTWQKIINKQTDLQYLCGEAEPTLYSWMMPFCWSERGGSHETLMDVLLWLPTVSTVTCCGGALGANGSWVGRKIKINKYMKNTQRKIRDKYILAIKSISCFFILFFYLNAGFVSLTTSIHIHTASTETRCFQSHSSRWNFKHFILTSSRLQYLNSILSYAGQAFWGPNWTFLITKKTTLLSRSASLDMSVSCCAKKTKEMVYRLRCWVGWCQKSNFLP